MNDYFGWNPPEYYAPRWIIKCPCCDTEGTEVWELKFYCAECDDYYEARYDNRY